ncbi:methylated-DNA--[protein]-cysteine S-methyltransferase [Thiohalobacter sp. IOR34]|uniref:methylated-DNA--[protein]-cysteine S-methyltransferase n=1 Tax=Thiohalobacter sp. IOR34 TaxID=3057176 RepID=UPI0025B1029D|nr:methylated-DNA--[protein]-cysteine S-methyltransferase [Thiohalobacter sp. IOR34]WJW74773.1 methylated-DNA--[protein]-cysteine S-methyltransferase [Thiohalobacter sp. IOR34]
MAEWQAVLDSPLGRLGLRLDATGALTGIDFLPSGTPLRAPCSPAARRACDALEAYFKDPRRVPPVPLRPRGSPFQRRVWAALAEIPPGECRHYGELATRLGSAPRAVGQACRRNPVPILIPCHRVVAASGEGGYAGAREGPLLAIKRWLLAHERQS